MCLDAPSSRTMGRHSAWFGQLRRNVAEVFLAPNASCLLCGDLRPVPSDVMFVCAACHEQLTGYVRTYAPCPMCGHPMGRAHHCDTRPLSGVAFAYPYSLPVAQRAVRALKFHDLRAVAPLLGEKTARACAHFPVDAVIPVPLSRQRLRARGYNQAALLAQAVAHALDLPCLLDVLSRVRNDPPQAGKRSGQRRNLDSSFRATNGHIIGRRLLLVDDVYTTGQTAAGCARALLAGGAAAVYVATVAGRLGAAEARPDEHAPVLYDHVF